MIKPKKAVLKMKEYVPPTSGRENKLRLDFNENTVGCSPKVIQALKKIDTNKMSVYPEYSEFISKLAKRNGVDKEEIVLTNATDEAIKLVMDTFIENGEEIIIPTPTFAMFKFYAELAEATIKEVLYNKDLSFPTDKVLNSINEATKLIVLVSPNNPTGTIISDKDILSIVKKAEQNDALVIIDEAYYEFCNKSSVNLINDFANVLVLRTFSKAYGLAGIRLGFILGNNKTTKYLMKAQSPYSVNAIALIAAETALDNIEFVRDYVKEVNQSKEFVKKELGQLGIKTFPTEANFLIADFGEKCEFVYNKLKDKNILVRNRSKYPLLDNCLRIGIGTIDQSKTLIQAIRSIMIQETILFDMDGVLVDVSSSYRKAIQKTAEFFTGTIIDKEEIQELKEKGGYNNDWDLTEAIILKRGKSTSKEEIINKFQEYYLGGKENIGFIDNEDWLLNKSNLQKLYSKYLLGIVTGRPKEEALIVLKKYRLVNFFDIIIAMEDYPVEKSKPDPYPNTLALEKLQRKNAMYIGDSIDDMASAKKANIKPIGCVSPGVDFDRLNSLLRSYGAQEVLKDINRIMEVLE